MSGRLSPALYAASASAVTSLVALALLWQQDRLGGLRALSATVAMLACGLGVLASLAAVMLILTRAPRQRGVSAGVSRPDPSALYRTAVEMAWADGDLSEAESERLDRLQVELGVYRDRAEEIERVIMGRVKDEIPSKESQTRIEYRADPEAIYRAAVEMAWADRKLNESEEKQLGRTELDLGVAGGRAEDIERGIMGATREEVVSGDTSSPADGRWEDLVEECVEVIKDLDRHASSFDPARQELADHVILSLAEGLERTGVELISDDETFDSKRHEPAGSRSRTAPGASLAETLSPGFAVGRRVLRKARVRVE